MLNEEQQDEAVPFYFSVDELLDFLLSEENPDTFVDYEDE